MRAPGYIFCTTGPAVVWRLKIDVQAYRSALRSNAWSDAVEAAIGVIERGGELTAEHRGIIVAAIATDVRGGPTRNDLTELLTLVDARPALTREQLLAVPCPTCGAAVGAYCETRPGKVLLLPQHHAERFWTAWGHDDA